MLHFTRILLSKAVSYGDALIRGLYDDKGWLFGESIRVHHGSHGSHNVGYDVSDDVFDEIGDDACDDIVDNVDDDVCDVVVGKAGDVVCDDVGDDAGDVVDDDVCDVVVGDLVCDYVGENVCNRLQRQ